MRYFAPIVFLLLLGAAAWSDQASAQPFRARQGVQSGQVRSLDEILNGIRRERPGSLADVQGPNAGAQGEPHYRLKWLTPDGRVLWLDTDARTGRVLGVEGDDRGPPTAPRGGFPGFAQRRGGFVPNGAEAGPPPPEPPAGYEGGAPPRGYPRRAVPGYGGGPPPGYNGGPPPRYNGPPPGYQGPPPGYQGPPAGYDRGGDRGPRGGFGRFRYGR
jgi:hypothetical protein